MSSSTSALAPVATGAPTGNGTEALPPFLGFPISERAAYLARIHIGVTSTLFFFCLVTFATRIYQRIRPVWKVGMDDYFIVAGFVSRSSPNPTPTPYHHHFLTHHPSRSSPWPTG